MTRRAFSFKYSMRPIWISHHREWLIVFYELIDQQLGSLVVNVVIPGPVNDKEVAFQAVCEGDRRALFIDVGIIFWQTHVALLIDRVIKPHVSHGSNRHSHPVDVGITEHRIQRR